MHRRVEGFYEMRCMSEKVGEAALYAIKYPPEALLVRRISHLMPSKEWDEIAYPSANFNPTTVDVWRWISNCIPHYIMDAITYSYCFLSYPSCSSRSYDAMDERVRRSMWWLLWVRLRWLRQEHTDTNWTNWLEFYCQSHPASIDWSQKLVSKTFH